MKAKFLVPLALCLLTTACINKDYDFAKFDSSMTVLPGVTTSVEIGKTMSTTLERIVSNTPGYDPSKAEYLTDAEGYYKIDLLPDWNAEYEMKQDFNIKDHLTGITVDKASADMYVKVHNGVGLPINVEINGKRTSVDANSDSEIVISFEDIMNVSEVQAKVSSSYKKGSGIKLNKNDEVSAEITKAVITVTNGININL